MDFSEIARLSVKQRIVLADAIWQSITADRKKKPLTEEDIDEIQKNITEAEGKPGYMVQWEKIKKKHK